jgi:hypothetical protein
MANDGNYRELRYFTSWPVDKNILEEYELPHVLQRVTGQKRVPFGVGHHLPFRSRHHDCCFLSFFNCPLLLLKPFSRQDGVQRHKLSV